MVNIETDLIRQVELGVNPSRKRAEVWIDYSGPVGIVRRRKARVRWNPKNQWNTVDPVYGCVGALTNMDEDTGEFYGCPWGCYALFSFKKLKADFSTPVPQIIDEKLLKDDFRRARKRTRRSWVRNGVIGDPSLSWETTLDLCDIEHRMDLTPVVFTRQWLDPNRTQVKEMVDYGVLLHMSVCALDSDEFLAPREELVRSFLRHGGRVVLRNVTFHFDDTTEDSLRLWEKQDMLMRGDFGVFGDIRPEVLENPARLIRGKKQRNPTWKYVGDWAYFKAPTTKDHKFSPHNHNWTAGVLYDQPACWVGCRQCPVQCLTEDRQTTLDQFGHEAQISKE